MGQVDRMAKKTWIVDGETKRMVFRQVHYVPGLFELRDEILINAVDKCKRHMCQSQTGSTMPFEIRASIDREKGTITVENTGGNKKKKKQTNAKKQSSSRRQDRM